MMICEEKKPDFKKIITNTNMIAILFGIFLFLAQISLPDPVDSAVHSLGSTGYYLSFTGGENTYYSYSDGGYSHIEYGDEIVFEVMQDDGFVRLYARVEE